MFDPKITTVEAVAREPKSGRDLSELVKNLALSIPVAAMRGVIGPDIFEHWLSQPIVMGPERAPFPLLRGPYRGRLFPRKLNPPHDSQRRPPIPRQGESVPRTARTGPINHRN